MEWRNLTHEFGRKRFWRALVQIIAGGFALASALGGLVGGVWGAAGWLHAHNAPLSEPAKSLDEYLSGVTWGQWALVMLVLLVVATALVGASLVAASEAGADRRKLAASLRQKITAAVHELSSQFTPAARSLSPHLLARIEKLTSLIASSLHEGGRRRTLHSAVARWIPKYDKDGRLDIIELTHGAREVNKAIAALQAEDVNANAFAVDDSWVI